MPEPASNQIAPTDYIPEVSITELQNADYNYRISMEDIIYCIDVLKLNQKQTADRLQCNESNISQRLKAYGYQRGDLQDFKKQEAERYAIRRMRIAKHLTDDKIEKMSAYQLSGMDGMALANERLIRGESTDNVAFIDMTKAQELAKKGMQSFRDKYGLTDTVD
jgi:hypothetical protein